MRTKSFDPPRYLSGGSNQTMSKKPTYRFDPPRYLSGGSGLIQVAARGFGARG